MNALAVTEEPQRLRALQRANAVRFARAELKRRIADGEVETAEIVLTCPWEAETMPIGDLLMCQHRWGRARCRRVLATIPLLENKLLGTLTERQRVTLAAKLRAA